MRATHRGVEEGGPVRPGALLTGGGGDSAVRVCALQQVGSQVNKGRGPRSQRGGAAGWPAAAAPWRGRSSRRATWAAAACTAPTRARRHARIDPPPAGRARVGA
eukprot:3266784-Prymnesium_polylepis.1